MTLHALQIVHRAVGRRRSAMQLQLRVVMTTTSGESSVAAETNETTAELQQQQQQRANNTAAESAPDAHSIKQYRNKLMYAIKIGFIRYINKICSMTLHTMFSLRRKLAGNTLTSCIVFDCIHECDLKVLIGS